MTNGSLILLLSLPISLRIPNCINVLPILSEVGVLGREESCIKPWCFGFLLDPLVIKGFLLILESRTTNHENLKHPINIINVEITYELDFLMFCMFLLYLTFLMVEFCQIQAATWNSTVSDVPARSWWWMIDHGNVWTLCKHHTGSKPWNELEISITMKLQTTHFWMEFFGETTILYRCFGDFPTIFQVAGDSSKTLLRDPPVS